MRSELSAPYVCVRTGAADAYGGNQGWFPDENFRRCGCGVVACADTLLYLSGQRDLTREAYLDYVETLRRFFPLIPRRGIDGLRLALGMNACLRRQGTALRAAWCASGGRFWERLARMLDADLPAVLAVGPSLPRFWDAEKLPLYRRTEAGTYVRTGGAQSHFVTATGLDDERVRVATWGRELYLERRALARYMKAHGALFTNLLLLTPQ